MSPVIKWIAWKKIDCENRQKPYYGTHRIYNSETGEIETNILQKKEVQTLDMDLPECKSKIGQQDQQSEICGIVEGGSVPLKVRELTLIIIRVRHFP